MEIRKCGNAGKVRRSIDHSPVTGTQAVWAVILDYNTGPLLLESIASFRTIDHPNFHVVMVDNASTDGMARLVEERYPDIHVLRSEVNLGYTGGNNAGIRYALERGAEYVLIVNPDTKVVDPSFVSVLVEHMEEIPDAGILGPTVYFRSMDQTQNTRCSLPYFHVKLRGKIKKRLVSHPSGESRATVEAEVLNGVCILLRRAFIEEVGLYDPLVFMYGDDWDLTFRARQQGWRSYYIPVDSIVHLQKEHGYDYLGMVNFLLKRNAAYVLLKNGYPINAVGMALGGTAVSLGRALLATVRGTEPRRYWRFLSRLMKAYITIFQGRHHTASFGPPAVVWTEFIGERT